MTLSSVRRILTFITLVVAIGLTQSGEAKTKKYDPIIYERYLQYWNAGNYPAALAQAQKFQAAMKALWGTNHWAYAAALEIVGNIYGSMGRFAEAEAVYAQGIRILETTKGPQNAVYAAEIRFNLARVYLSQTKFTEAETLYRESLPKFEKAGSAFQAHSGLTLNNLAIIYTSEGRFAEAESFYKRALAIYEKINFKTDQSGNTRETLVGTVLLNLGILYERQKRYAEAEDVLKRAIATYGKTPHPNSVSSMAQLGLVYGDQGRHQEAEELYNRALPLQEKLLGPDHPHVAKTLGDLANLYRAEGRLDEAADLYQRGIAIDTKVFGANTPFLAGFFDDQAKLEALHGAGDKALESSRKATAIIIANLDRAGPGSSDTAVAGAFENDAPFLHQLSYLVDAAEKGTGPADKLDQEAFIIAQWAGQSSAGAALQQMALRFAPNDTALGQLVREKQDRSVFLRERNEALIVALSKPDKERNPQMIDSIRNQIAETGRQLTEVSTRLEQEFSDYAALSSPKPLSIEEVQQLLSPDEVLVFWLLGEDRSYAFAVTRDGFAWKTIPLGRDAVTQKIAAFRRGLDVTAFKRSITAGQPEFFDLSIAHELYQVLLGPIDDLVKTKSLLLVVPSGPLTALPVNLLVTETPAASDPSAEVIEVYRDAAWLVKRQAVAALPSVASLKALRVLAGKGRATKAFVGFGDPLIGEDATLVADNSAASEVKTRSYTEYWLGAGVDRANLAKALPRLPETAVEIKSVATDLAAPESDIFLGERASETNVKRTPLADYRIVYFATHGLVAGDIKGLAEPSLALSLPKQPTPIDDGLLTASEVAELKLNADWVVLSACNTIAGDKPGAEALSGLARAFFYAGARALLVSHWAVDSDAATQLTTSTFKVLVSNPEVGRAEALRRATLAYMADSANPWNAYPAFWAPFVVVGEGAAN